MLFHIFYTEPHRLTALPHGYLTETLRLFVLRDRSIYDRQKQSVSRKLAPLGQSQHRLDGVDYLLGLRAYKVGRDSREKLGKLALRRDLDVVRPQRKLRVADIARPCAEYSALFYLVGNAVYVGNSAVLGVELKLVAGDGALACHPHLGEGKGAVEHSRRVHSVIKMYIHWAEHSLLKVRYLKK